MTEPLTSAHVIADSISPWGYRLTTLQVTMHRFVLAEFNTHRMFSRSSASSRAIPVAKMLAKATENPAWPVEWPREEKGMQGGPALEGRDLRDAEDLLRDVAAYTVAAIESYLEDHPEQSSRLHKSLLNRPMEWFQYHTLCVTSTEWLNFFQQRASSFSPLAQPEIRLAADLMLEAIDSSVPTEVPFEGWHTPYIRDEDRAWAKDASKEFDTPPESTRIDVEVPVLCQISAARSARNSYETQDGKRDPYEDVRLFDRLASASPRHVAPFEMVATPANMIEIEKHEVQGNFNGWHQLRHFIQPHVWDRDVL